MVREDTVLFKGTKSGLLMQFREGASFDAIRVALIQKLESNRRFFGDGKTNIAFIGRTFTPDEEKEIYTILYDRFPEGALTITAAPEPIATPAKPKKTHTLKTQNTPQPDPQPDLNDDINDLFEPDQSQLQHLSRTDSVYASEYIENETEQVTAEQAEAEQVAPRSIGEEHSCLFVRNTVRSGHRVDYAGDVYIVGDVNAGAFVSAGGNITVIGKIRGVVHAGNAGDERALVVGMDMQPVQLRIAQYIAIAPEGEPNQLPCGEVAMVRDGVIVLEPCMVQRKPGKRR